MSGFPAILKGYVDRVFLAGFESKDDWPSFSGKKGVIIMTSGASAEELKKSGTLRALKTLYQQGLMEYCGIELVRHIYLDGVDPTMSPSDGERHLEAVRRFVRRAF